MGRGRLSAGTVAHSGSGGDTSLSPERWFGLEPVANAAHRLGWALVGAALPAVLATVLAAAAGGSVDESLSHWLASAMETNLAGDTGIQWAFHVSVVTALAGGWVLGVAFLVEGFLGVDE